MRAVLVAELRLHWVCNFVILCRFQWDHVHFAELAPQILGDLFEDMENLGNLLSCTFLYILVHSCTALSMDRRWNKFDVVWVFSCLFSGDPGPLGPTHQPESKSKPSRKRRGATWSQRCTLKSLQLAIHYYPLMFFLQMSNAIPLMQLISKNVKQLAVKS